MRLNPFSRYEWMIAWRYLRARRKEGGVNVMTLISFLGIALSVFALIATLAVRSGFRSDFVSTILSANAHVTLYPKRQVINGNYTTPEISDYSALVQKISAVEGVVLAVPVIAGQAMATSPRRNAAVQVFGLTQDDFAKLPGFKGSFDPKSPPLAPNAIALGSGVMRTLGADQGDPIKLISPDGVKTAFGTSPRVKTFTANHVFTLGRYDIDNARAYMLFQDASSYFNKQGADQIHVWTSDPDKINEIAADLLEQAGQNFFSWTWQEASGAFLRALKVEDDAMFILLSILVLIASLNILSGLVMLTKNKQQDIGILRTIGMSEGNILRIFFLYGASIGIAGTIVGTILGCLFAIYIDSVAAFINIMTGSDVWDPSIRGIYKLPARLVLSDVVLAVSLSLALSFGATFFPARRAARLNPVEALRYG